MGKGSRDLQFSQRPVDNCGSYAQGVVFGH